MSTNQNANSTSISTEKSQLDMWEGGQSDSQAQMLKKEESAPGTTASTLLDDMLTMNISANPSTDFLPFGAIGQPAFPAEGLSKLPQNGSIAQVKASDPFDDLFGFK
uniref:Uncharacterized protein n=1 Tax=Hanusia phi TaxID=3032 RepID=A0A7S0HF32_9CRYP|mmetsp:Transcript_15993/g.36521  ORF Transcript_15993/g.36521 Transcript_15993/m.36521 type:complete len:107 (+) Transcript_15993:528-848(+)